MPKIKNSDLLNRALTTLITITARRSSEAIACAFMDAILKTLTEKYSFLKYVTIKNMTLYEENSVHTDLEINSVKPEFIGRAVESVIRILIMDLEEESGLYFIKEIKDRLGETYLLEFKKYDVDMDLLQLEQKHLHEQLEKKRSLIQHDTSPEMKEVQTHVPEYSWDSVASFKYRNNVCFLYDKNGKLLDKLQLNEIIEYYIRTLTDFGKLVKKQDELDVTEKECEFLEMLRIRDMDEESAKFLLNISKADFEHMIQRLLRYEILQFVSDDEIKLTDKGIAIIEERKKPPEQTIPVQENNTQT